MKTIKFNTLLVLVIMAGLVTFSACNKDDDPEPENTPQSIVDIASGNPDFSILVDALAKANLVGALQGDGPFTVFAPTNKAFEDLFDALNVSGLDDLTAEELEPILLYHVAKPTSKSAPLVTGYLESLNTSTPDGLGAKIYVEAGNMIRINGSSNVTTAGVEASNGEINIIDKVILPPTIVDLAISNPDFSILVEAVVKSGLVSALNADGPYTVFAPNNDAFEALFAQLEVSGIDDLSADALTPILLYHVVNGNKISSEVTTEMVPTLNENAMLDIMASDMGVTINQDTQVIAVDVQGTNGVIHVIDKVLLP